MGALSELATTGGQTKMNPLNEALDSLAKQSAGFVRRLPSPHELTDYAMGISEMIVDMCFLAREKPIKERFSNQCCSAHYANGRFCNSFIAVNPGAFVEIKSGHFLDKSENQYNAKLRVQLNWSSIKVRFRKWNELYHGGSLPGKPFFWFLKEPAEVFKALAEYAVFSRQPDYSLSFFEELAYLPAVLARYAAEGSGIEEAVFLANRLEERIR